MTATYTEDTLRALNKTQFIELLFKIARTKVIINALNEEMQNVNKNFKKLKSDIAVIKNVYNILCKQMASVKRKCW